MDLKMIVFAIISLMIPLIIYVLYVGIIKKRNNALESLSTIDVQLKMRSDLIPNILKIAKKYMEHERELIETVTALRSAADAPYDKANPAAVKEHFAAADQLALQMGRLQISMEAYPTLKADQVMMEAQNTYNEMEAQISAARRSYNASVTELKNSVEIFPSSFIASRINIKSMPFFETDEASKSSVDASAYL
jgi:LemA protein